jgi:integrase
MLSEFVVKSGKMAGKCCAQESWYDSTGKRIYVSGFGKTKQAALMRLGENKAKAKFLRQQPQPKMVVRDRKPKKTLLDLLNEWQEAQHRLNRSAAYLVGVENNIKCHLGDLLDTRVVDLSENLLKQVFADIRERTADTPTAYRNVFKSLHIVLRYGMKQGVVKSDPLRDIENPTVIPKVRKHDREFIEDRSMVFKAFLAWLRERYPNDYCWVLFMTLGFRESELCGFTLDTVNGILHEVEVKQQFVNRTKLSAKGIKSGVKNGRDRTVALSAIYWDAYLDWMKVWKSPAEPWANAQLFAFQYKNGTWHGRSSGSMRRRFSQLLDEFADWFSDGTGMIDTGKGYAVKWEALKFRPHYVRHIATTNFMRAGVSLEITQEIVGHIDPEMTKYYTHVFASDAANAVEQASATYR